MRPGVTLPAVFPGSGSIMTTRKLSHTGGGEKKTGGVGRSSFRAAYQVAEVLLLQVFVHTDLGFSRGHVAAVFGNDANTKL